MHGAPAEEIVESEDNTAHRLTVATCSALADLIAAHAAHSWQGGARELVDQIRPFIAQTHAAENLVAVRDRDVDADIIDALLALHEQRRRERAPHQHATHTPEA